MNSGEDYVYDDLRYDANRRGLEFSIDKEWFAKQCHLPCHYCGRMNRNVRTVLGGKLASGIRKPVISKFRFNGLDRVDNSRGYVYDNLVPCCAICNRAKREIPYEEFMQYISDLVDFRLTISDDDDRMVI